MDNGKNNNYTNFSNGYISIAPQWATSISLYFESFHYEQVFDYIRIYDGPGPTFPLIGQYTGTELLGQTIYSTGPYLCIRQFSDDILTYEGFTAMWNCILGEPQLTELSVSIYPNPVRTALYVSDPNEDVAAVDILDQCGRIIFKDLQPNKIDISSLENGIYFVVMFNKEGKPILQCKIIKME